MFIIAAEAAKEKPIKHASQLWEILDRKMFENYNHEPLNDIGVAMFKQHAMQLFQSYYSFGLIPNKDLLFHIEGTVNSYLGDRFGVPPRVAQKVKVLPRFNPLNWDYKEGGTA